ncbi:hypothetical protein Vadar_010219 [Vaccinium darrowii]|uniref:Uncharacterized protein n=1 Tax=Vaccinium darrowii TaxID=229202 RepID=A0ACB7YUQ2_9ERIC|nr:hypothetical protein Vadar_010219 [Vaccinium darrowii]
MWQKKSTVGVEILAGTKDPGHHSHTRQLIFVYTYELFMTLGGQTRAHINFTPKSIFYILVLPSLRSRHSDDKLKFTEMEHFDDFEDQVSITVDQNEVPISDSEEDSFYSSVFDDFWFFKRYGLAKLEEGNRGYQMIKKCITDDMGNDTDVAAIHQIPWSGPNGRGRSEAFRISSTKMAKKRGGNANVRRAWYGGSRTEICGILSHGFRRCRQSDDEDGFGVYLSPSQFIMDGALSSAEDEYGLRHVLLCNVILGKMEEIRTNSKQFKPSSLEFDSGVDNLSKPTRIIIWEAFMKSRIFPIYVVSFRALNARGFGRAQAPEYNLNTPCVGFSFVIPKLANFLPPSKMVLIGKYQSEFQKNKISKAQLIHRLRQLAGDGLLNDLIKSYTNNKELEGSTSSASADP